MRFGQLAVILISGVAVVGNIKDPSVPLDDLAFDALVSFVETGLLSDRKLVPLFGHPKNGLAGTPYEELREQLSAAYVRQDSFEIEQLRLLGLNDAEITKVNALSVRTGLPLLAATAEIISAALDTLGNVQSNDN